MSFFNQSSSIYTQRESLGKLVDSLVHIAAESRQPTREEVLQIEAMNFMLSEACAMLGYLSRKWRSQLAPAKPPFPAPPEDMTKGFFNIGEKK